MTEKLDLSSRAIELVDCDVHIYFRHEDDFLPYLPPDLRRKGLLRRMGRFVYVTEGKRRDSWPPNGGPPGSDPEFMDEQLLRGVGVDVAFLIELLLSPMPDPEFNTRIRRALNTWTYETWLTAGNSHGRYRGSISVAADDPAGAVEEIEHWAGAEPFLQVSVPQSAPTPYGHPAYLPIWEAAARSGRPVAIHSGYGGGIEGSTSPAGYSRYFMEFKTFAPPLSMAAHLVSLMCNGVFDTIPDLRFLFVEGGVAWVAPLIWRLEKSWDDLRATTPGMKRRPREYFGSNIFLTTQPIEEPEDRRDLIDLLEMVEASEFLLFASDYPHYDFDDPHHAFPRMPDALKQAVFAGNARRLYGLPSERRVDHLDFP